MGSYYLVRTEFQFNKIEKTLEIDGSDGCVTVRMYLIVVNYTF